MKKKCTCNDVPEISTPEKGNFLKLLRIMKWSFILILAASLHISAASYSQMTLSVKNAPLPKVLREIQKQSGYDLLYAYEDIDKGIEVSIDIKSGSMDELMTACLKNTSLTYEIVNKTILIKKSPDDNLSANTPQENVLKGVVTDKQGTPLPGVTILIKGTLTGVATDAKGVYQLRTPEPNAILVFSFVGMKAKEITFTGQQTLNVTLEEDTFEVDEVVVTGAFTRRANTYTGAVSTIKGEELRRVGNQNVLQSLKNIDPSFMQIENLAEGSNPNALPEFQLRGQTGFADLKGTYQSNPNLPLFILDGFETDLTKIIDLDMNIVESVTLLKDATAKAIYGSKAANGVVVVETKRPETGKVRIAYNGNIQIEAPDLTSYNLTNSADKLEAERRGGLYTTDNADRQIDYYNFYNNKLKEVLAGVDSDWMAQPLRTGTGQKHALYLEGGDEHMLYGVDVSYNHISGVMKGSDRKTLTGGITLTYRTAEFLFRNKLSLTFNNANDSPWGTFDNYVRMNPYNRIYDEDGQLIQSYNYGANNSTRVGNPMWNAEINTKNISRYTDITNNFYAEWSLNHHLKLTGRLGVTKKSLSTDNFKPASHTDFVNNSDMFRKGSYYKSNGEELTLNGDLGVNYSFNVEKHLLFFNGQLNFSSRNYENVSMVAEGFPNDNMDHIIFGTQFTPNSSPGGYEGISRSVGGIASVNYSYDNRFLFDANYRLTGSSEFGAEKRWGSFWSLGAGWNIHNEAFLLESSVINQLRLRLSTGYTGSQGFNTYEALATVKYYTDKSYDGKIGSYLVGLANPYLQWQKKYDQNIGLNITLFNNRVTGRFDYYLSTTKGMLTDITTPQSTGFLTYRENLGETENNGYEAYISTRVWENLSTGSYFNVFASVAHNKNRLKKISDSLRQFNKDQEENLSLEETEENKKGITSPLVRYEEGQSMNAIWAVRSLGIDPANGKEIFVKKNGEVTYEYSVDDMVACGDTQPKINGNIGFNSEISRVGFGATFTYRLGGQMYNQTLVSKVENADLAYNVDQRVFTDRWQKPGDMALYKSITDRSYTRSTSRFVEDYNNLTLSSLSVYYDFRDCGFFKRSFLEQLKVSAYMNDVFVLSSIKTERGTSYPFSRTVSISIQATF